MKCEQLPGGQLTDQTMTQRTMRQTPLTWLGSGVRWWNSGLIGGRRLGAYPSHSGLRTNFYPLILGRIDHGVRKRRPPRLQHQSPHGQPCGHRMLTQSFHATHHKTIPWPLHTGAHQQVSLCLVRWFCLKTNAKRNPASPA